ncbi:MAG: gluconate 2-dehydrogenase subunit 3 family protein, partial [Candidatus Neomarinimicrobiota bacterium]
MKRRDSIKTILLSAIGTSITLESCITPEGENIANKVWEYQYGRTAYEKSRDEKFLNSVFFNDNELSTIERIANIIVPPNEFGDIKDAGVVEMIEFIAKDWSTPAHNNYGENV